jgi:hypothetical protein
MTDTTTNEIGPSFSPEEDAFFSSGGEKAIPAEAGADIAGGDADGDAGKVVPEAGVKTAADKVEKMVSLSALHEERTKRQERDTENRKLALENAELKGKFSIIEKLNAPVKEAVKPAATAEEDIFGVVNKTGDNVAQLQKRLDDADAAAAAAVKETNDRNTFVTEYKADAVEFEKTAPDYRKAYDFLLNSRAADLKAIGYDTPEKLHNALNADEYALAQAAKSQGKSAAAMVYELAKARGYKLAAVPKAGEPDPDVKPGTAADRLDKIAEGQAAHKSLGDLGGEAPGGAMTAAELIAMPMDEFEAWTAKHPAKAKRLMGG